MATKMIKEKLSRKEMREAEKFGGHDPESWLKKHDLSYCDKGGHKERSIANQPNHKNHWKGVNK
jgi:hypothetical protein